MAKTNASFPCFPNDNTFGPTIPACNSTDPDYVARGGFDFTLFFEQSILGIGPSAVLLLLVPARIWFLKSRGRRVRRGRRGVAKLIAIALYGVLQLLSLILWARPAAHKTDASVAAATLGLIDAVALCVLSYTEHVKSIQPSSIISLFVLFTVIFDAVQCRTLWLLPGSKALAVLISLGIAVKISMLVLEGADKRRLLMPRWIGSPPEAISGILNRGIFWWVNEMMGQGWRGLLNVNRLYPTDSALRSEKLLERLRNIWDKCRQERRHALAFALVKSLKWPLFAGIPPRLCHICFTFAQPFLINAIIDYLGQPHSKSSSNVDYGLIGATGLVYVGLAIFNAIYNQKANRFVTACRGALVSLIFSKTLEISATTAGTKGSATLTLMSTDVERICDTWLDIHDLWSSAIESGIALWLLQRQLGVAFISPALIGCTCAFLSFQLPRYMVPAQKMWNAAIQERVGVTSSVLGQMKEVKLLGLTQRWSHDIHALRVKELELNASYRKFIVAVNVVGNATLFLAPMATFGVFILVSKSNTESSLSVATAFTSLSLINLLSDPLSKLFSAIPRFATSLACFDRIQEFLNSDSHTKFDLLQRQILGHRHESPAVLNGQVVEGIELGGISSTRIIPSTGDISPTRYVPTTGEVSSTGVSSSTRAVSSTGLSNIRKPRDGAILILDDACFGLKADSPAIIYNVNIQVKKSSLNLIVGAVGSGKSTLLKGMLGEIPCISGTVERVFTRAAYCDQQTWLINDTIQNNIIGESNFNSTWYERVIRACDLDQDFARLVHGDNSVIGSKGITLSGGQKQRVALARAIYSQHDVLIIDDVLSGLDWLTEEHVWSRIFGSEGLLRQHDTTVIFATHAVRHIQAADNIVVMGADGTVIEQGTFNQLNLQDGYVQSLLLKQGRPKNSIENPTSISDNPQNRLPASAAALQDEQGELSRKMGDSQLYLYYLKSIGWTLSLSQLGIHVIYTFLGFFPQIWIKLWAEAETAHPGEKTGVYYGILVIIAFLGLLFMGIAIWFYFVNLVPKSANRLHQILLNTVMKAPLAFFVSTDTGVTINRFSQDMTLIDMSLPTSTFITLSDILRCFAGMILIITGSKFVAIAMPFVLVALYALQMFYLRTSRQMRHIDLEAKSPLYSHFLETLSGISTIRAFGWTNAFHATSLRLLDLSQRPFYLLYCIQQWLNLVLNMTVAALAVLVVALAIETRNTTSAGLVGVALLNILTLSSNLAGLITYWTALETSLGAIARLRDFERDTPQEVDRLNAQTPAEAWPATGLLEFNDVTVSYSAGSEPVIRNVSFTISPGEKIAVCGRTGSGKSSLILALFRLLEPDSGSILLDRLDLATVPAHDLRSRLIVIPQEPTLFPGTVRFNIAPFSTQNPSWPSSSSSSSPSEPTDAEIIHSLSLVSLWPHLLAHGGLEPLSAAMSDIPLSHGQKQLLCLARALLRKDASSVLVLDEATSNVDAHTDALMQRIIREEFAAHTVVAVVHKLDTVVKGFDRILVLERGSLVEFGRPRELLAKPGGVFRGLWDSRT